MLAALLVFHISVGVLTGLCVIAAAYVVYRGLAAKYRVCALVLGVLAGLEVLSGTALAIFGTTDAAVVCQRIALYVAFVALAEGMLYVRMRQGATPATESASEKDSKTMSEQRNTRLAQEVIS